MSSFTTVMGIVPSIDGSIVAAVDTYDSSAKKAL